MNEHGDITEEQLKIMRFAIIKSIPRATLTDKLENELTKEIYKKLIENQQLLEQN